MVNECLSLAKLIIKKIINDYDVRMITVSDVLDAGSIPAKSINQKKIVKNILTKLIC